MWEGPYCVLNCFKKWVPFGLFSLAGGPYKKCGYVLYPLVGENKWRHFYHKVKIVAMERGWVWPAYLITALEPWVSITPLSSIVSSWDIRQVGFIESWMASGHYADELRVFTRAGRHLYKHKLSRNFSMSLMKLFQRHVQALPNIDTPTDITWHLFSVFTSVPSISLNYK